MPTWSKIATTSSGRAGERAHEESVTREQAIVPVAAAKGAAARRVRNGGTLTRKMALSLTHELWEAFGRPGFARALQRLEDEQVSTLEFGKRKRQLMLSEQARILPKYGFQGTSEGVERMMGELAVFEKDPEISHYMIEANERLRLSFHPEDWSTVGAACRKLHEEPRARGRAPATTSMLTMFSHADTLDRTSVVNIAPPRSAGPVGFMSGSADYEPWPPGMGKPFYLYVVGSWNDRAPMLMWWEKGVFYCPISVGLDGWEFFQLIQDNDVTKNYYPSINDATPLDTYSILGPGGDSDGRYWLIGSAEGSVRPGTNFEIIVEIDADARIVVVDWIEQR